jgi:prolyl-tRNA synthetase
MKQSQLFTKTKKEFPADEVAKNAQLLIRAGYIYKEMAGVYAYLPLGLKVIENIKNIVRTEMNKIGGQEMIMTSLQRKELWEQTNRWSDETVDIWFKSELKNGSEIGLAWSHEEPITNMVKDFVSSYRDLPFAAYQFQNKLRNELRAKSGIMRTREFVMKDLYSYSANNEQHDAFYNEVIEAYNRIFAEVGVGESTFMTAASGGAFTEFSHEFQTLTDAGEDIIYINKEKGIAINEEVYNEETLAKLGVTEDDLEERKAAEVGNIFSFGGKKSEELGLTFVDEDGETKPVVLGSYGIGIGRLMGVLVEHFADDRGLVWPKNVAPYQVHLLTLNAKDEEDQVKLMEASQKLVEELEAAGVEVLWDDRADLSPGAKFADADLMGLPLRLVISQKTMAQNAVEWKERTSKEMSFIPEGEIVEKVNAWL